MHAFACLSLSSLVLPLPLTPLPPPLCLCRPPVPARICFETSNLVDLNVTCRWPLAPSVLLESRGQSKTDEGTWPCSDDTCIIVALVGRSFILQPNLFTWPIFGGNGVHTVCQGAWGSPCPLFETQPEYSKQQTPANPLFEL